MSGERNRAATVLLDFERPIVELEVRIEKLRALIPQDPQLEKDLQPLQVQVERLQRETFARLTRWQIVQLARHPRRPTALDYIERLLPDWVELQGDRVSGEDAALVGGPATFQGTPVMVIAHARGRTPEEEQARSFGMPRPSGFRKAVRLAQLADRLGLPILTLIDTPGAHPGAEAEEHGQALAIGACIEAFATVHAPVVACVVGEGGSGGALALAVSDRLLMQEYAIFPVISPEACSSILYRDAAHTEEMADALRLTARDLLALRLIDVVVTEPTGGAHRDPALAAALVRDALGAALMELRAEPSDERLERRYQRLRSFGNASLPGTASSDAVPTALSRKPEPGIPSRP
jgi:acetyl-CoA carboxylase carboxyl transferase subunit alpha